MMKVTEISVHSARALLQKAGCLLIDIRGAAYWASGTAEQAVLMDIAALKKQFKQLQQEHKKILIMCHKGESSQAVVAELGDVCLSIKGGFKAWQNAGYGIKKASDVEVNRYDRQIKLAGFGELNQAKLKQSHVLIIGMGGLGAPVATYLTAAGVGRLTLVDDDTVALHNLHRQVLYQEYQVGMTKVKAAKAQLQLLNSTVKIHAIPNRLHHDNVEELLEAADLVIDGSDNQTTRLIINTASLRLNTPWLFAAVSGFNLQVSAFTGQNSQACYQCVFGDVAETVADNCNDEGILGPVPALAAMIQSTEAIKYLTEFGADIKHKLLSYDLRHHEFKVIKYPAVSKQCPLHPDKDD